jgi:MoxR-like ATPase
MTYEFHKFPGLDAAIGLFAEANQLAVHFASQGGKGDGRTRNPDRRKAFELFIQRLAESAPSATVTGYRAGKRDEPLRSISGRLKDVSLALADAFGAGGWFRFDLWLELDPPMPTSAIATSLGLAPLDHGPSRVLLPDVSSFSVDEETRERFINDLDSRIQAVTDPSGTGQNKWRLVEELLASRTGLPICEVVVGYVSDKKHVHNRRRQRSGEASLRLLMTADPASLAVLLSTMEDAVAGKIEQDGATVAVAMLKPEGWRIVNVFSLVTPPAAAAVTLAELAGVELPPAADSDLELAESLFVPETWIRDVLWLLEDKKGLVLYGPPGTGKTYVAQQIAKRLQNDPAKRALVQLHPSYGYEEFFEGYRPTTDTGEGADADRLRLSKLPGPLKLLVTQIKGTRDVGVLVLDEMNRGNLPRIFGELYFLLEYRDRDVSLMYSPDERFRLPEGLRIIGTMNTADRSVALLDQALRRRFHFVGLFPDQEPIKGLLRRYLKKWYGDRLSWVADVLENANAKLDRNVAIGPSHFMRRDLDHETVGRIWRHSVMPTIEEHYFGQEDRIAEFTLDALRPLISVDDAAAPTS